MTTRTRRVDRDTARPPGPRGAEAVGTLARVASGRPLEACAGLFARYGDTVYLPVRPWPGLYILSRPEQAEHVLAARARQRLEDEVDAVLGDGPADSGKLPWTSAVVSEAMRLYPPAWTLERTAVADDDVCGTPVPAGSMVAVLPYLIHRNPAVWSNPAGFDPARFLSPAPERHRYAWIPFGAGKRGCIGAGFARQEAVLVLARLCRHYRLDLVGPGMPRPGGFVTLRPAGPVRMRLTRRG